MPEITIENGQRTLYYAIQQPASPEPSRPTVLLIHGIACTSSVWWPIMPSIAAAGYTCVALDNHGMGRSPYAGVSGHEQTIQDITEAMEILHLSPASTVLVVHSMGGLFGSQLATRCSLAGAVFIAPWRPSASEMAARGHHWRSQVELMQTKGVQGIENHLNFMTTVTLGPRATDLARALIASMILATSVEGLRGAFKTLCDANSENTADYAQISCPILVIGGTRDGPDFLENCNLLIDSASTHKSKKKLELLDDVGHWPMIEAREETTKAILDFLKTLLDS